MGENKIKVLLADDSAIMRILIAEILRSDSDIDLLATAVNGREAVEKARALRPDVVVTDVMMPEYDGLYVVQQLVKSPAIPVILLSSLDRTDHQIFEALQSGAFDFVDKPRKSQGEIKEPRLISLVKEAAKKKGNFSSEKKKSSNVNVHTFNQDLAYDIIVIGASTGGPGAVEFILNNLPQNLAIPVVIAQHMPERFIETFAERLNSKSILSVSVAQDHEILKSGQIYLAPGNSNVRIERDSTGSPVFTYSATVFKEFNNPSVDCLFDSVATTFQGRAIAVLLTGMGKDGMVGMVNIKTNGGYTIGQDESTCVVYGMPKAAYEAGGVRQVLKLQEIPGFIVSCLS